MAVARTRTSILIPSSKGFSLPRETQDGFSLIEMLIVIALMALITVFAIPSVSSYFQLSINSASRELAATIKETYNSSLMTGKVHRLVYDLKKHEYWVEASSEQVLLDTKESLEKEERRKKFGRLSEERPASPFKLEKTVTRKKMTLPRGVLFEDILTQQSPEPMAEGTVYTHFFPQGFTEQTVIHLKDNSKHHTSLVISPLLGKTDLYDRYATAQEIFSK